MDPEVTVCKQEFVDVKPVTNAPKEFIRKTISLENLPKNSKRKYKTAYIQFMDWKQRKGYNNFSESVLMTYIEYLSKTYAPPSIWALYSMLKSTLNNYHNVDISRYSQLKAFLRHKSKGYTPRKIKTFSLDHIHRFIQEAPDQKFLFTKTVLIFAICGACRKQDLYQLTADDIEDFGSTALIKLPASEKKQGKYKTFKIDGQFYEIYKKYADLRPSDMTEGKFFTGYENGRCIRQFAGLNKFARVPRIIAQYLHLKNPEVYSWQCLRTISSSIIADVGTVVQNLKPLNNSKPHAAESEDSVDNEIEFLDSQLQVENEPSPSHDNTETDPFADEFELVDSITADESNVVEVLREQASSDLLEDGVEVADANSESSLSSKTVSTQTEPILNEFTVGNSTINAQADAVHFSNCYNNVITINIYNRINK